MSEILELAKNKYERGHIEDAAVCAAIAQAEALEEIARQLEKIADRLVTVIEGV